MAEQHIAILKTNVELGRETRLLSFALPAGAEFPFVGGKYIIVDTGLPLADGKVRKRAYSILSREDPTQFEIAVRQVGEATEYLHAFKPGDELRFSGPWGKFVPPAATEEAGAAEKVLIVVTDTGITAALGLVQAAEFALLLPTTELIWRLGGPEYFLPVDLVERQLPDTLALFNVVPTAPIGHPERLSDANAWLQQKMQTGLPDRVFLAGDGAVILPWVEKLKAAGLAADHVHVETFFNHAKKQTGA